MKSLMYNLYMDYLDDNSKKIVSKICHYSDEGQYEKAIELINKLLLKYPDDVYITEIKADILIKLKNFDAALKTTNELIELYPDISRLWYKKGYLIELSGNDLEAFESYLKCVELNPRFQKAWCNAGCLYLKDGNYKEGFLFYKKGLELEKDDEVAIEGYIASAILSGHINEFIRYFNVLKQNIPKRKVYLDYEHQDHLQVLTNYNIPIDKYMKTLVKGPVYFDKDFIDNILNNKELLDFSNLDDCELWKKKGDLLSELYIMKFARICYEKSLELNPDQDKILSTFAMWQYIIGNNNEAIELYKKAFNLNTSDSYILFNIAICYRAKGEMESAIEYFDLSFQKKPDDSVPLNEKAIVLRFTNRIDEALKTIDEAIKVEPKEARNYFHKGVILEASKQSGEAISCYDIAIKLNPEYAKPWFNKGAILHTSGKLKEAEECYIKALQIDPTYELPVQNLLEIERANSVVGKTVDFFRKL